MFGGKWCGLSRVGWYFFVLILCGGLSSEGRIPEPPLPLFDMGAMEIGRPIRVGPRSRFVRPGCQKALSLSAASNIALQESQLLPFWPTFHLRSYGKTMVSLDLRRVFEGKEKVRILLQGPLPPSLRDQPRLSHPVAWQQTHTLYQSAYMMIPFIELKEPGVYRLIVLPESLERHPHELSLDSSVEVRAQLNGNLTEKSLTFPQWVGEVGSHGVAKELHTLLENHLPEGVKSYLLPQLQHKLEAWLSHQETFEFPLTPPLDEMPQYLPLLAGYDSTPLPEITLVQANAVDYFLQKSPLAKRTVYPLSTSLGLDYGYATDPLLSRREVSQSQLLAQALNSLAVHEEAVLDFQIAEEDFSVHSPEGLFYALLRSGHQVVMRQETMYADFMGLSFKGIPLHWPIYVPTSLPEASGGPQKVGMTHSQFSWQVTGPLVEGKVKFYLGIDGVGFFPDTEQRPQWTGRKVLRELKAMPQFDLKVELSERAQTLLSVLRYAEPLMVHLRRQQKEVADPMGWPLDGYGPLGVCNDTTAFLEKVVFGTTSVFPLVRLHGALGDSPLPPWAQKIWQSLPSDSQPQKEDTSVESVVEKIRRIEMSDPFSRLRPPSPQPDWLPYRR